MNSTKLFASTPPFVQMLVKRKVLRTIFLGVIVVAVIWKLGLNLWDNPILFLQQVINGLQLGFVYALIALGYTMVYGIVRLINFAHGDVFMVGAFVSYYAIARVQLHTWPEKLFPGIPPLLSTLLHLPNVTRCPHPLLPLLISSPKGFSIFQ